MTPVGDGEALPTFAVADAGEHIGCRVQLWFYPGWEEPERVTGWLHHVSRSKPYDQDQLVWFHLDDAELLDDGQTGIALGGYGIHPSSSFEVISGPTGAL